MPNASSQVAAEQGVGVTRATPLIVSGGAFKSLVVSSEHLVEEKIRRNEDMDEEDRESVVAEDESLPVGWSVSVG